MDASCFVASKVADHVHLNGTKNTMLEEKKSFSIFGRLVMRLA